MKLVILIAFSLLIQWKVAAQASYSGNVLDSYDKKYLEGVIVSIKSKGSVMTNARGYFSIQGTLGDTLRVSFPGFYDQFIPLDSERFMLIQLQDRANLLPTFQVDAEPYRFRFKDGKLVLAEDEPFQEKSLYRKVRTEIGAPGGTPGIAIYGAISYFTRRNTQLRRYAKQLEWLERRQGYLEIIDSDSIRNELMSEYKLDREQWDQIIIRFNQFHLQHEFLDWPAERVLTSLKEFIRIESYFID
ncbi:hypothetical protein [Algoriphagus sp.]|uniref:hypothetical protein n=1 Tax=Algoriphagus sp. TaxID=1872435 RepID=UPI00391C31C4